MEREFKSLVSVMDDHLKIDELKNKDFVDLKDIDKMFISVHLLGGPRYTEKETGFDHIQGALRRFNLTCDEAIQIIKDSQRGRSKKTQQTKDDPIIQHLKGLKIILSGRTNKSKTFIKKNKHSSIFIEDSFELWERLKNEFDLKESSRTDIRFILDRMQKDGFIHKHIKQTQFLDWLNDTYEMTVSKLPYSALDAHSNRNRVKDYNRILVLHKNDN